MHRVNKTGLLLAALLAFATATAWAGPASPRDLLVETGELAELMRRPNVVLVDGVDDAGYQRLHIPGAVHLFFQQFADFAARRENGFPAKVEDAERLLGEAGIDNHTTVIVYDGGEGFIASGLWFALDFFGVEQVKVLNGGFSKWVKEGRPATQAVPDVVKKKFVARARAASVANRRWVNKNLSAQNTVFLDARSQGEYTGKDLLPGITRGGHIPGARNLDWVKLKGKLETFKSTDQIKAMLGKAGVTPQTRVVTYCQQGIGRATFLDMAMKLAGYDNVILYTGSWQDWSTDPDLPVEK